MAVNVVPPNPLVAVTLLPHSSSATAVPVAEPGPSQKEARLEAPRQLSPPCSHALSFPPNPPAFMQPGLDPRARAQKEAELEDLKQQQLKHHASERERKLAVRYHKVGNGCVCLGGGGRKRSVCVCAWHATVLERATYITPAKAPGIGA